MLSTRREHLVMLSGLLVLNAVLAWDGRRLWRDDQHRKEWIFAPIAPSSALTPGTQAAEPRGVQSFAEIVDRNLFTAERNSRSPQEEVKAPTLPFLWGTMNLGQGWFALMAPGDQPTSLPKRVVVGEEIGGYKVVALAGTEAVVEWQGKKFNIDTADSVRRAPRSLAPSPPPRPETTPAASAAAGASRVTTVGPSTSGGAPSQPAGGQRRTPNAAGANAPPGAPDDAPAGAVYGGKRKVVNPTPFGDQVFWVDAAPAQKPAGDEKK